ncbi:hypothetical protein HOP50_13g68800 [Chloropicon primus]|uniref:Peptidylprolyl isomerase n=1 Tax=Chloropicon primus TaxID=1764295 RepID=A0A5B8MXS6_9CHLO|nr:hypothetical protein A3770_13p68600 [Chloropicon primus]UPR03550.1 hypothetical protein HOP50_13g68800 [Chloropicon primus]|mmetsp:Transcript_4873/g.14569  ORF Transcript_4873/g.14569 Transcript_4873/m.14569 type:complete len:212 (-) Transcript_4873:85-720(-)|eukprot:QDZ24342.1 hypothetical protein A3770_13p68600 [Chloropicon primus]
MSRAWVCAALCAAVLVAGAVAQEEAGMGKNETMEEGITVPPPPEATKKLLEQKIKVKLADGKEVETSRVELAFQNGISKGFAEGYVMGYADGKANAEPKFPLMPPPGEDGSDGSDGSEGEEASGDGGRRKLLQSDANKLPPDQEKILLAPVDLKLPNGTVIPTNYMELAFNDGRNIGLLRGYNEGYADAKAGKEPRIKAPAAPAAAEGGDK